MCACHRTDYVSEKPLGENDSLIGLLYSTGFPCDGVVRLFYKDFEFKQTWRGKKKEFEPAGRCLRQLSTQTHILGLPAQSCFFYERKELMFLHKEGVQGDDDGSPTSGGLCELGVNVSLIF